MTRPLLLSLLLLILSITTFAQDPVSCIPKRNYIGLGAGVSKVAIKDQLNTSLSYSGINTGLQFEVTTSFKKSFLELSNIFTSGTLTPYHSESTKKNMVNSLYENFHGAFLWKAYQYTPWDAYLFAGPALSAKLGVRINNGEIGNSALTYEAAGSLGLSVKASKYFNVFKIKEGEPKDFKIEGSLGLPLLSAVFTPPYIGMPESVVQQKASLIDLSSNYLGTFSNYFNLEMGLSLTYYLKNRNGLEFFYLRDFTSTHPANNPAKTLNQFLGIKLLYNLK